MLPLPKRVLVTAMMASAAVVAAAMPPYRSAEADPTPPTQTCHMTGKWVEDNESFTFDAKYTAKSGAESFSGRYVNAAHAEADVSGAADKGAWSIVLTYTDAGHRGMFKKLVGRGTKDPKTQQLRVEGSYKTFMGASDINKNGGFILLGTCK